MEPQHLEDHRAVGFELLHVEGLECSAARGTWGGHHSGTYGPERYTLSRRNRKVAPPRQVGDADGRLRDGIREVERRSLWPIGVHLDAEGAANLPGQRSPTCGARADVLADVLSVLLDPRWFRAWWGQQRQRFNEKKPRPPWRDNAWHLGIRTGRAQREDDRRPLLAEPARRSEADAKQVARPAGNRSPGASLVPWAGVTRQPDCLKVCSPRFRTHAAAARDDMPSETRSSSSPSLFIFGIVWFGQLISLVGSALTSFALGAEIFLSTGSTTQFSLLSFFYLVPMLVLSPFAGVLVDRWDRRRLMLLSDLGGAFSSLLIWLLFTGSKAGYWQVESWHYYAPVAVGAAAAAFGWPAYMASITLLVPKKHLGRANGMVELAAGVGQVFAPLIAGALMGPIGLRGILLIDLGTFLFGFVTLLFVRIPRHEPVGGKKSLWQQVAYGWTFIQTRPGLSSLVIFIAVGTVITNLVSVLVTPLVLSFTNVTTLGLIFTLGGVGVMSGGILMGIWGGGRHRMRTVLIFQLIGGLALFLVAVPPTVFIISIAAFLFLFTGPFVTGCVQTVWQRKVAPGIQGRVFAVRRMIVLAAPPVASLLAGPLADRVFEPLLVPGGALAGSVGQFVGTGPGRGTALLFVLLGVLSIGLALAVRMFPSMWNVETELPDADEQAPGAAASQPQPAAGAQGAA